MNYSTYNTETGKYTYVYDLEDCLNSIRARNKDNEDRIEQLQEENKKLKKSIIRIMSFLGLKLN